MSTDAVTPLRQRMIESLPPRRRGTNPVYAGAYAFGRTTSKVSVEDGRKRVRRGVRRPLAEWDVLLKDQHEGYIFWAEFERNQQVIESPLDLLSQPRKKPKSRKDQPPA